MFLFALPPPKVKNIQIRNPLSLDPLKSTPRTPKAAKFFEAEKQ